MSGLIAALEASASSSAAIDYFSIVGPNLFVTLTDHTVLGPYALPVWNLATALRGDWLPATNYNQSDVFNVEGSLHVALQALTSAATFDPTATDGLGNNLYGLLLRNPAVPVLTITGLSFTPDITYANSYVRCTNIGGCTITIPDDASVAFPINTEIHFRQADVGGVDFDALSPVHVNRVEGYLNLTACEGATVFIKKVAADTWDIGGLLAVGSGSP